MVERGQLRRTLDCLLGVFRRFFPAFDIAAVQIHQRKRVVVLQFIQSAEWLHCSAVSRILIVSVFGQPEHCEAFLNIGIDRVRVERDCPVCCRDGQIVISGIVLSFGQYCEDGRIIWKISRNLANIYQQFFCLLSGDAPLRFHSQRQHLAFALADFADCDRAGRKFVRTKSEGQHSLRLEIFIQLALKLVQITKVLSCGVDGCVTPNHVLPIGHKLTLAFFVECQIMI